MAERTLEQALKMVNLVVMDVDGVMTQGGIVINEHGEELKIFDVRDGSGIKYLMRCGIRTAILSGRACKAVEHRAQSLAMDYCLTKAHDKLPAYKKLLLSGGFHDHGVCYIGDDLPDIPPMRSCGLPIAVADAVDEVKQQALYVTKAKGGRGAVREVAEMIIKAQGKWQHLMERYIHCEHHHHHHDHVS